MSFNRWQKLMAASTEKAVVVASSVPPGAVLSVLAPVVSVDPPVVAVSPATVVAAG